MGLTLLKKKPATAVISKDDNPETGAEPSGKVKPTVAAAKAAGGMSFLKRGKEAQEIAQKETAIAEQKMKDKVRTFYLKDGIQTVGTFLDGEIKDGALDIPYLYMHTSVFLNGKYDNHFICIAEQEPCPICEGGATPTYVGLLTLLDHGPEAKGYPNKKEPNKPYKDQLNLVIAKRKSIALLTPLAIKRKGLTGCTFDISRTGEKEPSIGNVFDYTEKNSMADLKASFETKEKVIAPFNYDKIMQNLYLSAEQLSKLGFGSMSPGVGTEKAVDADYSNV